MMNEWKLPVRLPAVFAIFISGAAFGQFGNQIPIDITGVWSVAYHEDWIEVGTGPDLGDYTGLPINEAARQRALSYHPSMPNMMERQCQGIALDYGVFWTDFWIWREVDPESQELIAYKIRKEFGGGMQTIYMDGREHPPEYAPHTWQGFSTGEWVGNKLKVTTTHLKEAYSRRNGVPRGDRATMIHYYIRHGNHLTIARLVEDPDYLTEPLFHSTNYVKNIYKDVGGSSCEYVAESIAEGEVPNLIYWKNPHPQTFAERYGLSVETALGGAEQMYPDYIE